MLEFSRFEFKYVLHKSLRKAVEGELVNFMELDPFVAEQEGHKYFVRSLYFDDPVRSAFYDKIDGLMRRSKFRIRTYTSEPDSNIPQFLEEKGRYNNLVFKHRVELNRYVDDRADSTRHAVEDLLDRYGEGERVPQKFCYEYFRKEIRPVALVDYWRRPYVSHYDPEFRITFDEQLTGMDTDRLFPGYADRHRSVLTGYTIMEVKFGHRLPSWFHRILQSWELRRVSVAKICECMDVLGLAEAVL